MILIADSGATKTQWGCVNRDGSCRQDFFSQGYNPNYISGEDIVADIRANLPAGFDTDAVEAIYFYGAGVTPMQYPFVERCLRTVFGKAGEVTAAIAKGTESAKKNLVKVPVLKGTIPHEMEARYGGAQVFLKPAAAGTGLVAGGAMRAVLESVGVKDVLAKSKGSSNPHNLVKATIFALSQMRDAYTVAGTRGISMDKVFNG